MDTFLQDARFAFRSLRKSATTTIIAMVCLALGIGANTAIFSVVHAVLLDALPYRAPAELVQLRETYTNRGVRAPGSVSPPNYFVLREQARVFADVAAYMQTNRDLGATDDPERLRGVRSTPNLFDVLGARSLLGRTFGSADAAPGAPPVVVISEGLWRRRFGAAAGVLGSRITLDNVQHTVVGIMPASFDFPVSPLRKDFWVLLDWATTGGTTNRGNHSLGVVARLAPNVDSAHASTALATLAARLEREFPESQRGRGILLNSLTGSIVGQVRPALLILLGAVGLVLLIACANVANLLLARATGRRREIAIRSALGCARSRLVRQMLTESAMLAVAGGALGLAVAYVVLHALQAVAAPTLPRGESIGLAPQVLLFGLALSLATGLAFGLVPALRGTRADLRRDLSDAAGRTSADGQRHRTLNALIVGEIALSLMLLVGAGLAIHSFMTLLAVDPGFRPERVLAFHVAAPRGRIPDSTRFTRFYGPVLERLRALPGARAAALTTMLPIQDGPTDRYFQIVGRPIETDPMRRPDAEIRMVSSEYFRALGIPVLSGREFSDRDDAAAPPVAIINDELARQYFPSEDPIGKRMDAGNGGEPATIVGVVRSVRELGLDKDTRAEFYLAAAQVPRSYGAVAFVVSTTGTPESIAPLVRDVVKSIDAQQPIYQMATMNQVISDSLNTRRLLLALLASFAALALVLSAAGVYGVMSYGVSQRTREIGIRMALGARAANVTAMVLGDVLRVTGLGVAIGLVGATLLTGTLRSMLYGIGARDPITFVVVPGVIVVVAVLAGTLPALRASRVDPLMAMRVE